MAATIHPVTGRSKQFETYYATPGDFTLGPGATVEAARVLREPGWSPYCLDAAARRVCFVRVPAGTDLYAAPFSYLTQYQRAEQFISMPAEDALALAAALPDPGVILVFSIARCGTTLMSHALNGPAEVAGLSEPGIFEHRPLREWPVSGEVTPLIRAMTRLLFATRSKPSAAMLALKFRSQASYIADMFHAALPEAHCIFMYRDAVSWANSFLQFLDSMGVPSILDGEMRAFHWSMASADMALSELGRFIDLDRPVPNMGAMLAPGWIVHLEAYERLRAAGVPFLPLRYNELMADREGELARLFDHCGVPRSGLAEALRAFDHDSQEGTLIARRDNPRRLTPEEKNSVLAILAGVPRFADPDTILPGAWD